MHQSPLPLFKNRFEGPEDICAGRHRGNPESEAAHERIRGRKAALCTDIVGFVRGRGGATCYEIEIGIGLSHQTCSARCSELKRSGQLVPTGEKRRTASGSLAAVLRAAS